MQGPTNIKNNKNIKPKTTAYDTVTFLPHSPSLYTARDKTDLHTA